MKKKRKKSETYKTVNIGYQEWMAENLNVSHFRNGDPIPEARTNEEWEKAAEKRQPAWCYYDNKPSNGEKYGKLYNWFTVNDPRGIAPEGWHVPNDNEWKELTDYLGGDDLAGGKLKDNATKQWVIPNIGATNETGFAGLAGGWRAITGNFCNIWYDGNFWSTEEENTDLAWLRGITSSNSILHSNIFYKGTGYSVRCLRD